MSQEEFLPREWCGVNSYLSCIHFKGHLSFINVDGGPSDAEGESTLDVQMVAGLASAATIKAYQTDGNANDDPWTYINDELQHIFNDNSAFDVTSGNNLYYPATPGWDYATGLGTPNLASFDQAVSNTLE